MNMNHSAGQTCEQVLEHLDCYLDRELESELREEVSAHLSACDACTREQINRQALRDRFKTAVGGVTVSPEVAHRIQQSIRTATVPSGRDRWRNTVMTIAAAVTICAGGLITYQLGHLRMTTASQESYISSISQRVAGIMRVGLGDHVHCAVYRKLPKQPPSLEEMAREMGPQYKDLMGVFEQKIPQGYRVVLAHQCRYHGRQFVHLSATNGSRLMSLVISRRKEGESFTKEKLASVLSESGIPIYEAGVQRFAISGFETRDHLVYVVSDIGAKQNADVMLAMASGIRTVLARIES